MISQIQWSVPPLRTGGTAPSPCRGRALGPSNRSGTTRDGNARLHAATNAIKTVDHNGGLDTFLVTAKAENLSPRALDLKRDPEEKGGDCRAGGAGELRVSLS